MGDPRSHPMGWWESVRTAGWSGQALRSKDVTVSIDALRRQIRGSKRQAAAEARVAGWRAEVTAKARLPLDELGLLLDADTDQPPTPSFAFVDIEVDPGGMVTQLGVAIELAGRLVLGEGTAAHAASLSRIFAGRWVVAHNGADHDFPRLQAIGVDLPPICLDSLRWSWLAWPTESSHALGALAARHLHTVDATKLHDAVEDARVLAEIWRAITSAIHGLDSEHRSTIRSALGGIEPGEVLTSILGTEDGAVAPLTGQWLIDSGAPAAVPQVLDRSTFLERGVYDGEVLVVESLHDAVRDHPGCGLLAREGDVIDAERVDAAPPSWGKAVAMRVLAEGRGCTSLAPPSAQRLLADHCRSGPGLLRAAGHPLVADLRTVTVGAVERPLVFDVPLGALFETVATGVDVAWPLSESDPSPVLIGDLDEATRRSACEALEVVASPDLVENARAGAGVLVNVGSGRAQWLLDPIDVGLHEQGAILVVRGPVGGPRSRVLWQALLGPSVQVTGPTQRASSWTALEGAAGRSARHPGRRTAHLLGVAAARQAVGKRVLVIDGSAQRHAVERTAASLWWSRFEKHLLRPPAWPTLEEAARRLDGVGGRTALVGERAGRQLASVVDEVLLARAPLPALHQPTMRRLVGPDRVDPFGDVVEPLTAHLVAELVATAGDSSVIVADPLLGTGVLSELIGEPTHAHAAELGVDEDIAGELTAHLLSEAGTIVARRDAVDAAVRRLLGPVGITA